MIRSEEIIVAVLGGLRLGLRWRCALAMLQIEVAGSAKAPHDAREKINKLEPDVLTLDVEMPKMDGVTFSRNLMRLRPTPVIMLSTLTEAGAEVTFQALEVGAIDYVSRPRINVQQEVDHFAEEIISKVKLATRARVRRDNAVVAKKRQSGQSVSGRYFKTTDMIIAMGASTGGTEALKEVISHLPSSTPGLVITQHIPVTFSKPFSERLNANSAMTIVQATDGQHILTGYGYLAPGDQHLEVVRDGARFVCRLLDTKPVNRHKPSVEVMFNSVARNCGANALGVLLTGMGNDGSEALGKMQKEGAPTIVQDEATSVVWGMPGEAVKHGYADEVLALDRIAERMLFHVMQHG